MNIGCFPKTKEPRLRPRNKHYYIVKTLINDVLGR